MNDSFAGEVTSPNFPDGYPTNFDKNYTIEVEEGLTIELVFTAFEIEHYQYSGGQKSCPGATLTIIEGNGTELMDERCGWYLYAVPEPALTSKSNAVKLLFHTGDVSKPGWSLSWRAVFDSGVLSSPNFPESSPANFEKNYTIEVEEGLILSIEFTDFELDFYNYDLAYEENYGTYENGETNYDDYICHYSHLTITDGDGTTLVEEACGSGYDLKYQLLRSKSNVVKLHYFTKEEEKHSAWSLNWRAVTPGQIFLLTRLNQLTPNQPSNPKSLNQLTQTHQNQPTHPNLPPQLTQLIPIHLFT